MNHSDLLIDLLSPYSNLTVHVVYVNLLITPSPLSMPSLPRLGLAATV